MLRILSFYLFVFLIAVSPAVAQQQSTDTVAKVARIQNAAVAMQDALPRSLSVGSDIQLGDIISTGKGARLELEFTDGTRVKLGERAQFTVLEFVMSENGGKALMRIIEGAFNVTSGSMMKLADAKMTVETEAATIGIRGTQFWGGDIGNGFEIALIEGLGVDITTKAGQVALTRPGDGTHIAGADAPPADPVAWARAKIDRAVATISFQN